MTLFFILLGLFICVMVVRAKPEAAKPIATVIVLLPLLILFWGATIGW